MQELERVRLELQMCREGIAAAEAILNEGVNTNRGCMARPFINKAMNALAHTDPAKSLTAKARLDLAPASTLRELLEAMSLPFSVNECQQAHDGPVPQSSIDDANRYLARRVAINRLHLERP